MRAFSCFNRSIGPETDPLQRRLVSVPSADRKVGIVCNVNHHHSIIELQGQFTVKPGDFQDVRKRVLWSDSIMIDREVDPTAHAAISLGNQESCIKLGEEASQIEARFGKPVGFYNLPGFDPNPYTPVKTKQMHRMYFVDRPAFVSCYIAYDFWPETPSAMLDVLKERAQACHADGWNPSKTYFVLHPCDKKGTPHWSLFERCMETADAEGVIGTFFMDPTDKKFFPDPTKADAICARALGVVEGV